MNSLLSVNNLKTKVGDAYKLQDVSLNLDSGELVVVLGANGAGKSSLLGAISGLYSIESGSILLDGNDITNLPSHKVVAAGLSLAPQDHPIFESLTVEETLQLGKKEIDPWLLDLFPNISAKRKQMSSQLSGGERQMLSMAVALLSRPKVLMLDEPSSGLAPKIVKQVFGAVQALVDKGVTILMVEQNAKEALKIATRAYVMEQGKIVLEGTASELSANDHVRRAYLGL